MPHLGHFILLAIDEEMDSVLIDWVSAISSRPVIGSTGRRVMGSVSGTGRRDGGSVTGSG